MVDVTCSESPLPGARVHADVALRAGGSAVGAALAAAEAGAAATVVGRIGADAAGELVLSELAAAGVAAELARDGDRPTGLAVAFPGSTVVATRGANAGFAPEDVPEVVEAEALVVSGFALFQPGSSAAASVAIERFTGAWIGIDVASPTLAAAARDGDIPTPPERTVLFATAEEARALTGAGPAEAARTLGARFAVACVKLGADGALAVAAGSEERRRVERIKRRSPFGAGDAFAGAFLVALSAGDSLGSALDLACAAGAHAAASAR
jgi:sugar/nucleoside kinase (ribokinase family)